MTLPNNQVREARVEASWLMSEPCPPLLLYASLTVSQVLTTLYRSIPSAVESWEDTLKINNYARCVSANAVAHASQTALVFIDVLNDSSKAFSSDTRLDCRSEQPMVNLAVKYRA